MRWDKPGGETEVAVDEEKEDENANDDVVCRLKEFIVVVPSGDISHCVVWIDELGFDVPDDSN
jgi:hypothetical protein